MAAGAETERAEGDHRTAEIPQWKREEIDALGEVIDGYDSIGIVSVAGIPSRQLQAMRADLHGRAVLRVARNTLLVRALDGTQEDAEGEAQIADLTNEVTGQVGVIATDDNPFGLFKQLEASKTPAPINAGEVAPNDITIPEGDTGIDPGPFVGELQQVGASARIMEGSIRVTEDSTVLAEGEVVSSQLAGVLGELEIEPKEVGLDLRAVYSEGAIFEPEELALDLDQYRADFEAGAARARDLSIGAAYPTAQTAPALLSLGASDARGLGLSAAIESPELMPDLLSQASADLRALAGAIDDEEALPEKLRGAESQSADSETEDSASEGSDAEPDTDEEEADTDEEEADTDEGDDDDDDDSGDAFGAMFG